MVGEAQLPNGLHRHPAPQRMGEDGDVADLRGGRRRLEQGREVIVDVRKHGSVFVGEKDSLSTKCPSKFTDQKPPAASPS